MSPGLCGDTPPHHLLTVPLACVQFAPPIVQPLLLAAEYTLMLILLLAVFMCSLWFLVHRDFPYCHHPTTLGIKVPPPPYSYPHPLPCSPFWVTRVLF